MLVIDKLGHCMMIAIYKLLPDKRRSHGGKKTTVIQVKSHFISNLQIVILTVQDNMITAGSQHFRRIIGF
jgi:hypothetical protein